ncbi:MULTISPECIES: hypothetical protein [Nonomuraea]|uniref:Uncharacterized protein n=1 Tax=Nonomuraea salmonea TaxID=46181 RepID=A0ABV5P416_9ACTN
MTDGGEGDAERALGRIVGMTDAFGVPLDVSSDSGVTGRHFAGTFMEDAGALSW